MSYSKFISEKLGIVASSGIDTPLRDYALFPHQRDLTKWALRRGRAAIFADTGLGKMRMAIAWADTVVTHSGQPVIILCPLAVAQQFVAEGVLMGVEVTHIREPRRGVQLWTNPGEVVLSPFAGIGSEGHVALQLGRKFVGVELKESYYQQAARNLDNALRRTGDLFEDAS